MGLQLSFNGVENANVSKRSKNKPFFQDKRLGVKSLQKLPDGC